MFLSIIAHNVCAKFFTSIILYKCPIIIKYTIITLSGIIIIVNLFYCQYLQIYSDNKHREREFGDERELCRGGGGG